MLRSVKKKIIKRKDLKKDQNQNKKSFIRKEMILGLITLKHDFGPIYPLFVQTRTWPTLRTLKVHLDQM